MQVLCIRLPKQDSDFQWIEDNVPYDLAMLMSYAEDMGAIKRADWDFLDSNCCDYGGDRAILDASVNAEPKIILFSLFDYNLDRSLWIARRLRALLPGTYLAAIGPEVVPDMPLFKAQIFDSFLEGCAETAFLEFLRDAAQSSVKPRYCPRAESSPPSVTNPYLAGILPISYEKRLLLCSGRGSLSYPVFKAATRFPPVYNDREQLATILKQAARYGVVEAMVCGQYLDERPDTREFLKTLAAANDNRVELSAWMRPEKLDEELVMLLDDASIYQIHTILGSVNKKVLDTSNISLDKKAFEQGISLLWTRAITLKPEIYLALPHESYESSIETYDFLGMLGIGQDAELKPIPLSPGSVLRRNKHKYGIKESFDNPPYWINSTDWMDDGDIINAIADFEDSFDLAWVPVISPSFSELKGGFISSVKIKTVADIELMLHYPEKLAASVSLILSADNTDAISRFINAARDIRKENPYILWQFVLCSDTRLPSKKTLEALMDAFYMPEHYYELSRIFSLDAQASSQARFFFATKNEALALTAVEEHAYLETVFVIERALPGQKLLDSQVFIAFNPDALRFEKLYDVMNAYRDYPELLLEYSSKLF